MVEEFGGVGDVVVEFVGVDVVKGMVVSLFGFEVVDFKDVVGWSFGCMVRKRSFGGNYLKWKCIIWVGWGLSLFWGF